MQANNILQFSQINQKHDQQHNRRQSDKKDAQPAHKGSLTQDNQVKNKVQNSMTPEGPLGDLIQYTKEWTDDAISTLFDNVDTQLFEMAEKAENSNDQNIYFDAMRIIRLRRAVAHDAFMQSTTQSFTPQALQAKRSEKDDVVEGDLSLITDDTLEEDLAINNMVAKAEKHNKKSLDQLNQRLAYLYKGLTINTPNNPMGPTALCHSFAKAAKALEAEIKVKLLIFKLFDLNIITKLDELYEHANQLLVEQGILPNLKVTVRKPRKRQPSPEEDLSRTQEINANQNINQSAGLSSLMQQPMGTQNQMAEAQAFALIQQLISQNKPQQNFAPADYASTNDVVSSLSQLQVQQIENNNFDSNEGGEFIGSGAATSALLKEALRQSLQSTQQKQAINQGDDDLIDVIGMLFDFILDDDNLVDSVKSLLSRLQIPIIKIALQDKTFFRNKNHPARQLLNELANAGLGVTDNVTVRNNPLYLKLENIVSRISNDHSQGDDATFFDDLLDDLHRFLAQFNHGLDNKKTPSKDAALELVTTELESRLNKQDLPENIVLLLERVWKDVMFDIFFSDGMESDEWDMAMTFVDTLIWSVDPKADAQSQKQLVRVIPGILNALNAGLDRIQYPKDLREQLLQDLQNCHMACMRGQNVNNDQLSNDEVVYITNDQRHQQLRDDLQKANDTPDELTPEELERIDAGVEVLLGGDLANLDVLEEEDLLASLEDGSEQAIADNGEADLIEDKFTEQARNLVAGAWVEFKGADNQLYRAKISWMSEDASAYIFVTQTGQIAEKSLQGLSDSLRTQKAHILDESPVFERAMDALLEDLQDQAEV